MPAAVIALNRLGLPTMLWLTAAFCVQLAANGKGVALGWNGVIDLLTGQGTLVRASDYDATLGSAYFLTWPSERAESSAVRRFRDWVLAQTNSV